MSRKTSQPLTSPQPGGGVNFLERTMIERESTGKRPIRPKNVEDLLHSSIQDESDDPDFDCKDEDSDSDGTVESDEDEDAKDVNSRSEDDVNADSDESDDEDYKEKGKDPDSNSSDPDDDSDSESDSSDAESEGSNSDEPETAKKSALRETLQKLNEANNFVMKRRPKKKRKSLKTSEKGSSKKSSAKAGASRNQNNEKTKSKSKLKSSKQSVKSSKNTKRKRTVVFKKSRVSNKKSTTEKKRKKSRRPTEKSKSKQRSIASLIDCVATAQKENRKEIELTKPICSACLGDKSDDTNEIVECDSCGISVHEICYGLSPDNLSISSGSGSSSCTEPWFCDVCKSGSENMYCELCPVEGGLFKESTAGRWIHLVCAMYTQGVALHNDSTINLYEIHYARWGSHNCAACENERQAQTGIVIPCDAGMCKTYFHATCAQKLGLLSDPNSNQALDILEADPYYVSCKLHTSRETVKRRVKIFNTLQEQLRIKKERKELEGLPSGTNEDQARILRKLEKVRQKTALKRAHYLNSVENIPSQSSSVDQLGFSTLHNLPSSWINGNKKQRLMHTSAKLGNDFLRKTERLGEDIVALELEVKHEKIFSNIKRKWNVLPAMSVEYSAYYADRENRISGLVDQCNKSLKDNSELIDKEISLKDVWETHAVNQMAMREETESVSKQLESLASILTFLCPSDKKVKLTSKMQTMVRPKDLFGGRKKSPSSSRGDRKSPTPRRSSTNSRRNAKARVMSPSPSRTGKMAIAVCHKCSNSDNQHLITRCDKCRKYYHLGCLDPPLARMPKRSRLCGWMCSDCCDAQSENERQVDTDAPRTLRGRTKLRKPGKYRGSDESDEETKALPTQEGIKKSPGKLNAIPSDSPETKPRILLSPSSVHSGSPTERRRRSGSISLTSPRQLSSVNSTIESLTIKSEIETLSRTGNSFLSPVIDTPTVMQKAPSKKGKSTPKTQKMKSKQVDRSNLLSNSVDAMDSLVTDDSASTQLHSTAEGPVLTSFKVNGISEVQVATNNEMKTALPKVSKKRNSKVKVDFSNDISKNGMASVGVGGTITVPLKVKARPRKKKDPAGKVASTDQNDIKTEIDAAIVVKTGKPKPSRKKKGKVENDCGTTVGENKVMKKGRKKNLRTSINHPSSNFAPRDEKNGVNLSMGKVTSQILVDKMREIQNGTVKAPPSKKRKSAVVSSANSQGSMALTPAASVSSAAPSDEKEKSIPPKKRKRAPSNAQQQQQQLPNSLDSIIKAVSSGDFIENNTENGEHGFGLAEVSTIMQGISPMSSQLAPEQNIMQGKAMGVGPGVNLGETFTVDASFIIDGAPSNFGINASAPFYSSSKLHCSTESSQGDGTILKLSGGGNEGFKMKTVDGTSGDQNVIRLQYIDSGMDTTISSVSDSIAMPPPPAPSAISPNIFTPPSGVCATCTKTDIKMQLVICDKCQLEFHFMCLIPPIRYSPRRKGTQWFCKTCDDDSIQENGVARHSH